VLSVVCQIKKESLYYVLVYSLKYTKIWRGKFLKQVRIYCGKTKLGKIWSEKFALYFKRTAKNITLLIHNPKKHKKLKVRSIFQHKTGTN
jgi:hypothetical protein